MLRGMRRPSARGLPAVLTARQMTWPQLRRLTGCPSRELPLPVLCLCASDIVAMDYRVMGYRAMDHKVTMGQAERQKRAKLEVRGSFKRLAVLTKMSMCLLMMRHWGQRAITMARSTRTGWLTATKMALTIGQVKREGA